MQYAFVSVFYDLHVRSKKDPFVFPVTMSGLGLKKKEKQSYGYMKCHCQQCYFYMVGGFN